MKKFIAIFMLIAAAVGAAPKAYSYSEELKEFADILNSYTVEDGCSISYDGKNLLMLFPALNFNREDIELLESIDDLQILVPIVKNQFVDSMGYEMMGIFSDVLSEFEANLILQIQLNNGVRDIIFTPADFKF